jgi:hypothetical protein
LMNFPNMKYASYVFRIWIEQKLVHGSKSKR